jgi:hypothetical protein
MVAVVFHDSANLVFISRLRNRPRAEYWIGSGELLPAIPLASLLVSAPHLNGPALYYLQIRLMLARLLLEALLDFLFKLDIRHTGWIVIS